MMKIFISCAALLTCFLNYGQENKTLGNNNSFGNKTLGYNTPKGNNIGLAKGMTSISLVCHTSNNVSSLSLFVFELKNKTFEIIPGREENKTLKSRVFPDINPEWIESISILKGKEAIDKYGSRGKNGVVIIELKKEFRKKIPKEFWKKFKRKS